MLLYIDRLKKVIFGTIMQHRLANTYYVVICIESLCDQNGWLDRTLVPKFCLCDLKNFLEEYPSSYLNLETPFPGLIITILSRIQFVLGS